MRWAGSRLWPWICVLTALAGCASTGTRAQQGPASTAPNVRIVQGEAVEDAPLLPEPGDIWAHIVPGRAVAGLPPVGTSAAPSAVKQAGAGGQPVSGGASPQAAASPLSATIEAGVQVQLTAAASQQKALAEWQLLGKRQPELLRGHSPEIVQLEAGGQTRWRLRAGGFTTTATAQTFCGQVKAAGLDCWVVGRAM